MPLSLGPVYQTQSPAVRMCVYVCVYTQWADEVVKPPPLPKTLTSPNETLNTSQSVKRAAKIETDPIFFHYSATEIDTFDNTLF